ncbi:SAV_2336 N-terminal domain-related protein [Kitasatospora sp. NPDC096140]|uniref:SAV_2336 N-terminal domain-related protein n=1 Tax=Kitasatospora sp. NPDC096140 TaxID=3155425 RepID=UPI00332DA178
MIDRLRTVLQPAATHLTPTELAEILWLARRIPPGGLAGAPGAPAAARPANDGRERPGGAAGATLPDATEPPTPAGLYAHTRAASPGTAARPVLVPAGRALPGSLPIGRALRPLRRTTASAHRQRLDEAATAELIAETGVLDVVLRPGRERWLSAALVVDDGLSMELWQEAAAGVREVMEHVGHFRTVRCFGLDSRTDGPPVLRARPFTRSAPVVAPASLCPADGRGTVLVLSDAIGAGWHRGRVAPLLAYWARRCPTAVVQPLPQRLWSGSALTVERLLLRGNRPGAANVELTATDPVLPELPVPGTPVPVLDLQPGAFAGWAALVAAGRPTILPALALAPHGAADDLPSDGHGRDDAPAHLTGRLAHFRRAASPEAYRLAGHLAAVRPLTLALMRLVQRAVHGRVDPAPLAEVLLGGLLRRRPGLGGPGPAVYDFRPGLRDLLLETVPVGDLLATTDLVGAVLRSSAPGSGRAPALQADLAGRSALAPGASAFALSAEPLLRHFTAPADRPSPGPGTPDGFDPLAGQDRRLAALVAAGRWRAAVERGEEVLDRLVRHHGPDSLRVLAGRRDLAEWIGRAGAPQTAHRLARELHLELARLLGPGDDRTLATAATAAEWAGRSGRPAEAVDRYRSVLDHQEPRLGPDHADTVASYGRFAYWTGELGDPERAVRCYDELLARQRRLLGEEHVAVLNTRANIGSWHGQAGRTGLALELSEELLRDVRRHAPEDHPLRPITEAEHAHWKGAAGAPAEAAATLRLVLPRVTAALGPAHSYPFAVRSRIARWTGAAGHPAQALELMRSLLTDVSSVLIPEHAIFLTCRVEYAHWTLATGDVEQARALLAELAPEVETVLGPGHPEAVRARELLAGLPGPEAGRKR